MKINLNQLLVFFAMLLIPGLAQAQDSSSAISGDTTLLILASFVLIVAVLVLIVSATVLQVLRSIVQQEAVKKAEAAGEEIPET